jgi:tetratricopeptide (TPR) repeat protein
MNCKISDEQLWSWIDREAPDLEEHLKAYPLCRDRAGQRHIQRFQREMQTLADLNHPSIAMIYEAGRTDVYSLGIVLYELSAINNKLKGDLDLAIEGAKQLGNLGFFQTHWVLYKGATLVKAKRYFEALETFNHLIELDPDSPVNLVHRAQAHRRLKDFEIAYEFLTCPTYANVRLYLVLLEMGRDDEAAGWWLEKTGNDRRESS